MNIENFLYHYGLMVFWGSFFIYLLQAIGLWKIFKKAGQPGWKAIIPVYNTYILYKICWQTKIFWIAVVIAVIGALTATYTSGILFYLGWTLELISVIIRAVLFYNLSLSFGHGFLYFLGLYFLSPIFLPILGFSRAQYQGNRYEY